MGRPREHNEATAAALLDAAEQIIQHEGVGAVSVRRLADEVGTTTRAVYSLFGSKDGLLVALGTRAFEMLGAAVAALPESDDPASDLVQAATVVFRQFAISHPILFRIGFQRNLVAPELASQFDAARLWALGQLEVRLGRLEQAGLLAGRPVRDTACHFHALCEGLAEMELRGALAAGREEEIWQDAVRSLVAGFAAVAPAKSHRPRARRAR